MKFLLVLTMLNVLANLVRTRNYNAQCRGLRSFFGHWNEIYIMGSGRWVAFEVLLPIAYLLILGPLLLVVSSAGQIRIWLRTSTAPAISPR